MADLFFADGFLHFSLLIVWFSDSIWRGWVCANVMLLFRGLRRGVFPDLFSTFLAVHRKLIATNFREKLS